MDFLYGFKYKFLEGCGAPIANLRLFTVLRISGCLGGFKDV